LNPTNFQSPDRAHARARDAKPDLPRPARLSLHDAIVYVAERCGHDLIKAGKAVFYALGEGTLIAHANVLNRYRAPGSFGYLDDGLQPVPAQVWSGYPWPWFELRAVRPRGMAKYREHTAEGKDIGPVFDSPTIGTADIDAWLDSGGEALGPGAKDPGGNRSQRAGLIGAETECRAWLTGLMGAGPPTKNRAEYQAEAEKRFGIGSRGFNRAWANAVVNTGNTDWVKPGRKSRRRIDTPMKS
jgi:hypothetical protein